MPARQRREAATPETEEATVTPINRGIETPHTERTKHEIAGRLTDEPRRRAAGDKDVTEMHVAEGDTNWTVTVWDPRGKEAWRKLQKGDEVEILGQWEADYDRGNGSPARTHQLTATGSIEVGVPGRAEPVPLRSFDRSMLTALETPGMDGLAAGGMSAAD